MRKVRQLLFLFTLCLVSGAAVGQQQSSLDQALQHLEENQAAWGLDKADIEDLHIADHVFSKVGEINHYYFNQRYEGIAVHNAITSVHVNSEGKAITVRHNFIPQLASKVNTTKAKINEVAALRNVLTALEIPSANFNFSPVSRAEGKTTFAKGAVSNVDIVVHPVYTLVDNEVRLSWDITLDPTKNADYWNIRVDALDGNILDRANYTVYCSFEKQNATGNSAKHSATCTDHSHRSPVAQTNEAASTALTGGTYNIFAELIDGFVSPHESPVHGERNVLVDPSDPTASPFGWLDVDGMKGNDFDITRGNNVHAYLDIDDDNTPDAGSAASGGEDLNFDFPWSDLEEPANSEEAAVSNLFFMNNFVHDFAYAHGFDESAGNFQENNYGNADSGANDYVRAEAQDGRQLHLADPVNETDHVNNANFATPGDGVSPRMQMFIWARSGGRLLAVNSPSAIEGSYETQTASFGPMAVDQPVENTEVAIAFDDDAQFPTFSCGTIQNPEDIDGKVAIIDRGGCTFVLKAQNAEAAGAVAVIICNFEDPAVGMGGDATAIVGIPSIMISNSDCNRIKVAIGGAEPVTVSIGAGGLEGADFFDGDVDNGIVAHEYGHGISNRLVGGPTNAGCLQNSENMGEGWSDFFTLVTTVKPEQDGTGRAGIGTYVSRENSNGNGIRTSPYSTDMSINPETFLDLTAATATHALGTIWTSMLWDMYWAMVDEHGFSTDLINGDSGNNMAVRLVIEGMKFTPCTPGFIDGRDGILAADEILFNGENTCMIWKVFANRGLGIDATQGATDDTGDGIASFEAPASCIVEVKLTKRLADDNRFADVVDPGSSLDLILKVRNDKDIPATEVLVTEEIAAGTTVSNISNGGEVVGDNIVWELGTMEVGTEIEVTYTLNTDQNRRSETIFIDDLEGGSGNWVTLSDSTVDPALADNQFVLGSDNGGLAVASGANAFFIADIPVDSRETLLLLEDLDIQGENPGVRFFQNFDTEGGSDGVLVQVSVDGVIWQEIPDLIFKNPYPRPLAFGTFVLPFLSAYSGDSDGWIDTWIDLSSFQGQVIFMRFRFGSDANNDGNPEAVGWAMDNFEFLNIEKFNITATVTTAENDLVEVILPDGGIKINSDGVVAVDDVNNPSLGFNIYPNPATETVKLAINNINAKDASLSVYNYGGQLIEERTINLGAGAQLEEVNVSNYPTGFYFFRLTTDRGTATEKIMVGK